MKPKRIPEIKTIELKNSFKASVEINRTLYKFRRFIHYLKMVSDGFYFPESFYISYRIYFLSSEFETSTYPKLKTATETKSDFSDI